MLLCISVLGNKVKQCSIFGQMLSFKKIRKINKIRKSFSLLFLLGRHFGGKFNVCKQKRICCMHKMNDDFDDGDDELLASFSYDEPKYANELFMGTK